MKVTITWTPSITASEYFIQYKDSESSIWIVPNIGNPTMNSFFVIDGLTEGTSYDFKITSDCCNGSNDQILTVIAPCSPTDELLVTSNIDDVTISWNSKDWAISYSIFYKLDTDINYIEAPGSPVIAPENTIQINGLTIGTLYDFQVRVNCNIGTSTFASTTYAVPCPNISNLTGNTTGNSIVLNWSLGYLDQIVSIDYKKDIDSTWTHYATGNLTSAVISGLDYNQHYIFTVTGICGSENSNTLTLGTTIFCPPISSLTSTITSNTGIQLDWILGYTNQPCRVEHKLSTDTSWTIDTENTPAGQYNYNLLVPGSTYNFRVTGKCGTFEINSLTNTTVLPCPDVTGLTAENA